MKFVRRNKIRTLKKNTVNYKNKDYLTPILKKNSTSLSFLFSSNFFLPTQKSQLTKLNYSKKSISYKQANIYKIPKTFKKLNINFKLNFGLKTSRIKPQVPIVNLVRIYFTNRALRFYKKKF